METSNSIATEVFLDESYLAELIRAEVGRTYATVCVSSVEKFSCHRNRIQSAVRARLGSGLAYPYTAEALSAVFESLVTIGDIADVGKGDYVPRETRVTIFVDGWGRISGGLPLDCGGYAGLGIRDHLEDIPSIGRMVRLEQGIPLPEDWEVASTYFWSRASDEQIYGHLFENTLGGRVPEITESCVFYNPSYRGRSRRERWQNRAVAAKPFVVVRKTGQNTAYFVIVSEIWYEISPDDARKWVLLAERLAKARNYLRADECEGAFVLRLPNMLPQFASAALFSAACGIAQTEKGWDLKIGNSLREYVSVILEVCNCVIS